MSEYDLSQFDLLVLLHILSNIPADYIWDMVDLRSSQLNDNDYVTLFTKKHAKKRSCCALGMVRTLKLTSNDIPLSCIVDFVAQENKLVKAYFPNPIDDTNKCKLVSKLSEALAEHPTLQILLFGDMQIISKQKLCYGQAKAFPLCSKAFAHLTIFLNGDQLSEISLFGYSDAFKDCAECEGSGELAIKSLTELIARSYNLDAVNLANCDLPKDSIQTIISTVIRREKNFHLTLCGINIRVLNKAQLNMRIFSDLIANVLPELWKVIKSASESFPLHILTIETLTVTLVDPLCQLLNGYEQLYKLIVKANGTPTYKFCQFLHSLQENETITELSLNCDYMSTVDDIGRVGTALSEVILHNHAIRYLSINAHLIEENYGLMARALLANSTLKGLTIDDSLTASVLRREIEELKSIGDDIKYTTRNISWISGHLDTS